MRKTLLGFCVTLALVGNGPVFAGGYYVGPIAEIQAGDTTNPPRRGWIQVVGNMSTPACASASWFVLDLTDTVVMLQYATAVSALANGKSVRIYGTGTCDGSYERVMSIGVQQ